jgi:hypothetical protein
MSALMGDVLGEKVTVGACNAACRAGQNMLKVVELKLRYSNQKKRPGIPLLSK